MNAVAQPLPAQKPPFAPGLPIIGNLLPFMTNRTGLPIDFMTKMARQYGDVVGIKVANRQLYIVSDPELVHEIMVTRVNEFHKPIAASAEARSLNRFLGDGILTADHAVWRPQRKLIQPLMHARYIESYATTITRFGEKLLASWSDGAERDMWQDMTQVTLWVIAETMFGISATHTTEIEHAAKLAQAISVSELVAPTPFWLIGYRDRQVAAINQVLDQIVDRIIAEYQANPNADRKDLLALLLKTVDEDGQPVSREFIRDNVLTMFFAGHETTANTLTWTFYFLDRNPAALAALQREVDSVLGKRVPTLEDLPRLPYTAQVLKETMRIEPIVSTLARYVVEPLTLGGYQLEGNSMVMFSPYILHHDPRWWDQPEQFDPQHFSPENEAKIPKFAYIPFGGGPRVCIGNHFSMMEAQLLLSMFVSHYNAHREDPTDLPLIRHITTAPRDGLKMRLTRR